MNWEMDSSCNLAFNRWHQSEGSPKWKQTNIVRSKYRMKVCMYLQVLPADKQKVSQSERKGISVPLYACLNTTLSCDSFFLSAPDLSHVEWAKALRPQKHHSALH